MFDHNIFQENLVGVDYCERMVKETNPGVLERANTTEAPHADDPRLPDHRRHHARAQPARGRVLPRGAAGQPLHPRDVLPDGGAARAPLDALPGRRRHDRDHPALHRLPDPADALRRVHEEGRAAARRPVRLLLRGAARLRARRRAAHPARLLGQPERPGVLRLPVRDHDRLGQEDVRDPGRHRRRQAGHQRPRRHQPRHPHPARQLLLRGLGEERPGGLRRPRPAGQPRRRTPPVEPAHDPQAGQSGTSTTSTPGSCRRAGSTGPTTSRSTPAAARSPGCGRRR